MEMAADKWFEPGYPSGDAAGIDQDLLHGLGNAMTANGRGTETRHQSDDQTAEHGHTDNGQAKVIADREAAAPCRSPKKATAVMYSMSQRRSCATLS